MFVPKPMATLGHIRGRGPKTAQAGIGRGRSEAETVSEQIPSGGENVLRGTKTARRQPLSSEVDQEDGDVGGGDAGDAGGLGDGGGAVALQFLAAFNR